MRTPSALSRRNVASARLKSRTSAVSVISSSSRPGVQSGLKKDSVNELRKLRIMQLHRRDVHGDSERIRPAAGFRACLSQHPFADLLDRSTFLRDGNEQGGGT